MIGSAGGWLGAARSWLRSGDGRRLRLVAVAFLGSRLLLELVGVVGRLTLWDFVKDHPIPRFHGSPLVDIWGVLDASWYMSIVEQGYTPLPAGVDPASLGELNHAFFPLYPVLVRSLAPLFGHPFLAGLALSNAAFFGALLLLHRWVESRLSRAAADFCVVLAAFFPCSYVFSSFYTESLFLLLLLGCLCSARAGRWLLAGTLGALLSGTRLVGLAVILPLLLLWLQGFTRSEPPSPRGAALGRLACVALVPCGLLAFMALLWQQTGDPLAFLHVQAGWGRRAQDPFHALLAPFWRPTLFNLYHSAYTLCGLAALLPLWRRRLWLELSLGALLIGVPMLSGLPYAPLASMPRYLVATFPIFMGIAVALESRPTAQAVALAALATLNGGLMVLWATGMWFVI